MLIRLPAIAVLVFAAGCAGRSVPQPQPGIDFDRAIASLGDSPVPPTGEHLRDLQTLAEARSDAGWARLHYLLDAFDDARFTGGPDSRAAVANALGLEPSRGSAATSRVLDALLVEADRLLAKDRLHQGALHARTLLEFDATPPPQADRVFQRMVELKTIARGGGPLAANARLRLFGYCRSALTDATRAPARLRPRALAHCLFPIYDSDPTPHLSSDAARRPPPPDWLRVTLDLVPLVATERAGRLSRAMADQRDWLTRYTTDHRALLSGLGDPKQLGLPFVRRAAPYDWTPVLALADDGAALDVQEQATRIAPAIAADGRHAVALVMAAHAPGTSLLDAAAIAAAAGATTVELVVGMTQRLSVPPGDYWSDRLTGDVVARHAVLPLSVATMPGAPRRVVTRAGPADASTTGEPRALGWDPSSASLGLHVIVSRSRWTLTAAGGEIARASTEASRDPVRELRAALARVRRAFPDEDGLVLVPAKDATYGAVVAAADAALRDDGARPLFTRLAIAPHAPAPTANALARRIARRAPATVAIVPASLSARAAVARRCYQSILERSPRSAGEVRLELQDGAVRVAGRADRRLVRCARAALDSALAGSGAVAATVSFSSTPD